MLEGLETTRVEFVKAKLKRTLNNEPRKADTDIDSIKDKIGNPDNQVIHKDKKPNLSDIAKEFQNHQRMREFEEKMELLKKREQEAQYNCNYSKDIPYMKDWDNDKI